MSASSIIMGIVLFAFQIYADFSGYSDIAIGSARLFNIKLLPNFNYPFFSRSIKELWQRWHISLMTWLREYIYFPLGGSRRGKWRTCLNIMIVFASLLMLVVSNYFLFSAFTSRKKAIINNRDQEFITLIGYAIYIDELQISLRRQGKRP